VGGEGGEESRGARPRLFIYGDRRGVGSIEQGERALLCCAEKAASADQTFTGKKDLEYSLALEGEVAGLQGGIKADQKSLNK